MATLNETNLNNWTEKITCHQIIDSFIGVTTDKISSDNSVLIGDCGTANIQTFQLTARTNFLKSAIGEINELFTTAPIANKILKLNNNKEIIADINNDQIKTKKIIIEQADTDEPTEFKKLKTDNFLFNNLIFENTSLIEKINNNITIHANSDTSSKLLNKINISNSNESNISLSCSNIDLSQDIEITATLDNLNKIILDDSPLNFSDVFVAFKLTDDGRVNYVWKKIHSDQIKESDTKKFVSITQIENWDNKVDNTFVPNKIFNNDTDLSIITTLSDNNKLKISYLDTNIQKTTTNDIDNISKVELKFHSGDHSGKELINFKIEKPSNPDGKVKISIVGDKLKDEIELYGNHNLPSFAPLANAYLQGNPTVDTPTVIGNETSNQIANVEFVHKLLQLADNQKWEKFQEIINFLFNNKHYIYNPNDCLIYEKIFVAKNESLIQKLITTGYDEISYQLTKWNNENMINFGSGNSLNTLEIMVPILYNLIWLRLANDRVNYFSVPSILNSSGTILNKHSYAFGYRNLINHAPDGGLPDSNNTTHKWLPIPINNIEHFPTIIHNGIEYKKIVLEFGKIFNNVSDEYWISGLAFSKNPFNHTFVSADCLYRRLNDNGVINTFVNFSQYNYNNDNLGYFSAKNIISFNLPIVNYKDTDNDRLIYFILPNDILENGVHSSLKCEDQLIERLRTTYTNPFAQHYNSISSCKYVAARIPAHIVRSSTNGMLNFTIDLSKSDNHLYFREIGIHEYIP